LKLFNFIRIQNDSAVAQNELLMDNELDWIPKVGKLFNTWEDAWKFWNDYGAKRGFNVRRQYHNKNKDGIISSARYVCSKEGVRQPDKRDHLIVNHRLETRTECPVKLGIKYMKDIEKYQIHDFVDKHNHHLHLPETSHMLSCQRKLSEVQAHEINLADDAGIKQRALFELMSRQVGGR
jgi:zinc finger SWIM domain-containing protein 3